uniref:asparaginase n=1 Tax=Schistocephalus solidus TaxID=70667 RepID=A0A0X3NSJ3_SCHSO
MENARDYVILEDELVDYAKNEEGCESVGSVLVLYTGGAIGMQPRDGAYEPEPHYLTNYLTQMPIFNDTLFCRQKREELNRRWTSKEQFSPRLPTCRPSTASVTLAIPLTVRKRRILYRVIEYAELLDSSNCVMDHWISLAKDIEQWYDHFTGFVILHGTDTLPCAASALSFIFENLEKPVVLTGSELPITQLCSDGQHNLLGALLFAGAEYGIPEVTVYSQKQLLRGNRTVKSSATDVDIFVSPNCPPLAESREDIKIYYDRIWKSNDKKRRLRVNPDLCPNVAILRLFPSISAETIKAFFQPPVEGVILQTYGAGNVPSNNQELIEILREASLERKILILNTTQCWRGTVAVVYATGAILNTLGVVSGCDMTPEAALMKMAYVLAKWKDPATRRRMLAHSLRGEMTEPILETRVGLQSIIASPREMIDASLEHTRGLGELLSNADANGLAPQWAQKWFDHSHRSPLHLAASVGSIVVCRLLLDGGANPNVVDKFGYTPLSYAIRSNNSTPALIELIRQYGGRLPAFMSAKAKEANNAARLGLIRRLRLYKLAGLTLEELDAEGRAALHTAVVYRQLNTVRYLIAPARGSSSTNLYESSELDMFEVDGAEVDPHQRTGYGMSALEEAKRRNFTEIVQVLEACQ